jgi:hypothetical protein
MSPLSIRLVISVIAALTLLSSATRAATPGPCPDGSSLLPIRAITREIDIGGALVDAYSYDGEVCPGDAPPATPDQPPAFPYQQALPLIGR